MAHSRIEHDPPALLSAEEFRSLRKVSKSDAQGDIPQMLNVVRRRTSNCRVRCSIKAVCCSFVLIGDEPHRWPRDRLADRRRIICIVLAAFEIGLHVGWRNPPNLVTQRLKRATPMMR